MSRFYHYTSQVGLLGILSSKSIWCTNALFLNDPTEFKHAIQHGKQMANRLYEDDYDERFGWQLRHELESTAADDLYVSSFSERPDLLSQWRGYCPGGNGYCLGFDREALEDYCAANGMRLEKCLYSHDDQLGAVAEIIAAALREFPTMPICREGFHGLESKEKVDVMARYWAHLEGAGAQQAKSIISTACEMLIELAPRFKHEGFHEEAEWRIITNEPARQILYRPGPSYVVPYISLDLLEHNKHALCEVIVGPNPNQDRARKAAEIVLRAAGYDPSIVSSSCVPFNYW
ncbi:DUF2971 domain-containing protein [Pseudomonas baltica]|jgi:hypothetical protein|uniref:DUF2971 domain-containing protein n=1 Tax=Pseudomonas baltica TaxID=2762576 RepID=A0A7X1G5K9_9PSED|nr:DUF2971 domain-containing protein [Pseudomonas baltica]MBC2678907.1 DUF2971 domain-containing protein [Pseudomonas baltica]